MTSFKSDEDEYEFNQHNVKRIKDLYSEEMKYKPDNPVKICMKLVLDCATEKDPRKRLELSYELSEFLTQPGGLMRLLLSMVDFDTSSQKESTHNQRFIAIANMIAGLPHICLPFIDFCNNIFKQLKSLLYNDNPTYGNLGTIIIHKLFDSPRAQRIDLPDIVYKPLIDSILKSDNSFMTTSQAVTSIYNMIINNIPVNHFVSIFPNLYFILISLENSPSDLNKKLKTILSLTLNGLKPGAACCLLESTLINDRMMPKYDVLIDSDAISVKVKDEQINYVETVENDKMKRVIMSILANCDNEALVLEYFFHFKEVMWLSRNEIVSQRCAKLVEPLLDDTLLEKPNNKLDLFDIIANNQDRSLQLIMRTLSGYLNFIRYERDERERVVLSSIRGCLDILQLLVLSMDDPRDLLVSKCSPVLIEFQSTLITNPTKKFHNEEIIIQDQLKGIIAIIEKEVNLSTSKSDSTIDITNESEPEYNSIMKDLNDKLVPVRVHGLVRLKQLFIENNELVISRSEELFSKIEGSIDDKEPYVFLACVNLIAEMTIRKTREILPKLTDIHSRQDLDLQHRINVGEVLVRLSKHMNETTPFYGQQVMAMLLHGTTDPEELIRMSSLTNIGELCKNMGDSLWKYVIDILDCIERVLQSDNLQVKCAAIDLLRTTLSGLDSLKVESIQRDLKRIYVILKDAKRMTLDDSFCLQVQLALDEIDRIAKEMLGLDVERKSDDSFIKNIKVLQLD